MPREIIIQPVLNGFVCHAGCQRVVFTSVETLARAIGDYYKDPEVTETLYLKHAINKMERPVERPVNPVPTRPASPLSDDSQ